MPVETAAGARRFQISMAWTPAGIGLRRGIGHGSLMMARRRQVLKVIVLPNLSGPSSYAVLLVEHSTKVSIFVATPSRVVSHSWWLMPAHPIVQHISD